MKQLPKALRFLWKIILIILSIYFLLHFLKDITQDLLGISTILDLMGNLQEDTSKLPLPILIFYYGLWIIATLTQPLLGFFALKTLKQPAFNQYDFKIFQILLFIGFMFLWAYLLSL